LLEAGVQSFDVRSGENGIYKASNNPELSDVDMMIVLRRDVG
jgi:hypothetical protein